MTEPLAPIDVLRGIRDAIEQGTHVGCLARDVAEVLDRSVGDIDPELRQLARERLADVNTDPMGSEWWALTGGGVKLLLDAGDAGNAAQRPGWAEL